MDEETNGEIRISLEITNRECQILADAIRFIWKSGAVTSKDGALELIRLEERLEDAIVGVKDKEYGPKTE